jgi:hypothetical protein
MDRMDLFFPSGTAQSQFDGRRARGVRAAGARWVLEVVCVVLPIWRRDPMGPD